MQVTVQPERTLSPLVKKLQLWGPLDDAAQEAILALPHKVEELLPHKYIVREGDRPSYSCLLLEGFAFRHKVLVDGSRSINAIHMKGDMVDLQNSLLGTADHSVQTLTRVTAAFIPREAIRQIAFDVPAVGMAMWYDTLVDASIFREWIANIARRDAASRIAHLLCEFGLKLEAIELGDRLSYEMPMTQEQLADATGLTAVHVNRTLMDLENRGLIARAKKFVAISDWKRMEDVAGFTDGYLHLRDESSVLQ
ncbi:MAG TPA: Crp/Fnr family transcriptional regulator [Allosphingosinicella sp.]|jgi:CRP-like cAMP-binding protein|uniref:Crp/Fnr family transcriptional regulator n=1 Tax=Allosphingosinicella sp. TaxID=2823234 RepID=UPI002F2866AA